MDIELYEILTEIAYGLKSKMDKSIKMKNNLWESNQKYIYDEYLIRAINKLSAWGIKYKIFNNYFIPKNETDAIVNIFSRSIKNWIKELENYLNEDLSDLYYDESLIELYGENKYKITECCDELASECSIYNMDSEQFKLFKRLRSLDQNKYTYLRKFIIENPIIGVRERSKLSEHIKRMGLIEKKVDEFIDLAYEKIPNDAFFYCSNCGWTVSMKGDGSKKCIDNRCREKTNNFEELEELGDTRMKLRLKPGIMRYFSLPGILELNIEKFCIQNNLEYTLWPNNDSYDIKVQGRKGNIIVIDAKDYSNAFTLAHSLLKSNNIFNKVEYTKAFIVVPDEAKKRKYDYCTVVNKALKRVNENVSCITITELFEIIGEV